MGRRQLLCTKHLVGTLVGIIIGICLSSWCSKRLLPCSHAKGSCCANHVNFQFNIVQNVPQLEFQDNRISFLNFVQTRNSVGLDLNQYIDKNEKGFLLIGVITAKKYLDSRAVAAFDTWTSSCSGTCKVIFFSSEGSTTSHNIPLVSLPGVDDSYPPQRKSLSMLKYMHDHYINNFEWFMRADDDIFVKGDKLEKFLNSINSSKPMFIGQAGTGVKDEQGKLFLGEGENFCMGGPGIVLSHTTLRMIAPHVPQCLNNLLTYHEDVEVGRCVRNYARVQCTWAFEMQHFFYHNYKEETGSFQNTLKDKAVRKALTLHSVKNPKQQYRIHNYFSAIHIQDLHQKEILLLREMREMELMIGQQLTQSSKQSLPPSLTKYQPRSTRDVLPFDFVAKAITTHRDINPKHAIYTPIKTSLEDVVTQLMQMINKNARQKGRTVDYKNLWYGYSRVSPQYGVDYILDLLLTYRKHKGKKLTVPVRRHAYIQQVFGSTESIEDPYTSHKFSYATESDSPFLFRELGAGTSFTQGIQKVKEQINFILPLSNRLGIFQRFMKNYEEVCLKPKESCKLLVILFNKETEDSTVEQMISIIGSLQKTYGRNSIEVTFADGAFERGRALDLGVSQCENDALLFFIDVDIVFTRESLTRIRLNTKRQVQVYYPIVFSQYDPRYTCEAPPCNVSWNDFSQDMGYWRSFGFGIVSLYREDYHKVGGFNLTIHGWGKEDVDLYSKFCGSDLTIFRAVDPHLVHAFHAIVCDRHLDEAQYNMCIGSKASSIASTRVLSNMVYSNPEIMNRKCGPS